MNILKNYIIKEWIKTFIASFLILFILITVANLLTGMLRNNVTISEVLSNYIIQIFNYFNLIIPISSLTASIFSINKIKNKNELTAIFSLGLSRKKYFSYIFTASALIGFISFLTIAFLKPKMASMKSILIKNPGQKFQNLRKQGLITSTIASGSFWYKNDDYFVSYKIYNPVAKQINLLSYYKLNDQNKIESVIQASDVFYKNGNWLGRNITKLTDLSNQNISHSEMLNELKIPLKEKPKDLLRLSADISTLNIVNLYYYINNLKKAGLNTNQYMVIFYSTINIFFICILLALLASIEIFTPNRRTSSTGKNVGVIFLFTICYWLVHSYLIEMGNTSKITAEIAVFALPLFLLSFFLLIIFQNRKLK